MIYQILSSKIHQISILDLEKRLFIIQPIKDKSEYDIQFLKDNKEFLLIFESKLKEFFDSSDSDYSKKGKEIIKTFQKIKNHGSLDLNRYNNYLDDIFEKNKFLNLDLFWNYSLCIFFLDNDTKDLYDKRKDVQKLISKIKEIKNNLNKIEELPLYEKARTIYSIFTVFFMKGNKFLNSNEIDNLNLRIFLTDQKEKDSIMDRSYQMYKEFVNNISEDSAVFPYLLNLNSGCGYYNKEAFYTFDLKNLDMIKAHLNQVYPKVIIFCYIEKGEEAMIESEFGGIIINDYYITKFNDLDYNSSSLQNITEEQKNDIAVGIFLKVIHEASELKNYRKREKDVKDNNEIEDNKNEENKTEDNNTHNKNKHYTLNYLKATNNYINKEESKNENILNENEQISDEKQNQTRMERVNDAIKRISERFNITKESCLRKRNLMEILKKLNIKDPYFRVVSFLISYINIKI